MFVNPFVAGILVTISVESIIIVLIVSYFVYREYKKNDGGING